MLSCLLHHSRLSVKQVLNHAFFLEPEGLVKVELNAGSGPEGVLSMRMEVSNKENKSKGHETVEFSYNLNEDVPETVAQEMVCPVSLLV